MYAPKRAIRTFIAIREGVEGVGQRLKPGKLRELCAMHASMVRLSLVVRRLASAFLTDLGTRKEETIQNAYL